MVADICDTAKRACCRAGKRGRIHVLKRSRLGRLHLDQTLLRAMPSAHECMEHPLPRRNFGLDAAHQPKPVSYPNQATAVLQKLAMLYGTHPACLGWGLLNEPVGPVSPGSASSCCTVTRS